ncbi:MAG: hypothetical protein HYV17_10850 [Xanthomonadales bacterium]|nr:hypothetical protein [Xanthomonadales bacterium]
MIAFLKRIIVTVALSASTHALADTAASGQITGNTTWVLAQSPYVVTSDVEVAQGATLTIEPGVTVHFQAGTNLRVVQGSLFAVGNSAQRILFTSDRDRAGNTAASGDWGRVQIDDGAFDATTKVGYADIRYGRGMRIRSASPTITHVRFDSNDGPAIDLDLSSSPTGEALQAVGNSLNGIRVPAGAIAGSVNWRLTGIPYVLESGEIAVGSVPLALTPATQRLAVGGVGSIRVELGDAAPAGGVRVDLSSSVPSVAVVAPSVVVPEGTSFVEAAVTAGVIGTSTVTASRSGFGTATAIVRVGNPLALSFAPAAPSVSVGRQSRIQINASETSPDDMVVTLQVGDPSKISAPATVVIPANATSGALDVQGLAAGQSSLSASAAGVVGAQAVVQVRTPHITWPTSALFAPGETRNIALTLSEPAPAGGLLIALQSSAPGIASVPATVAAAEGATTVTAAISAVAQGVSSITAAAPGYESGVLPVAVDTIAIQFGSSSQISPTVPIGLYDEYTVRLSKAAPPGGVVLTLTSSNSAVATLSESVLTIASGQTSASTLLRINTVSPGQSVVRAHADGLSDAVANVTVGSESASLAWEPEAITVGNSLQRAITLRRKLTTASFAWRFPAVVSLSASDAAVLGVPSSVTIPANNSSVSIVVSGKAVSSGSVSVTASAEGYASSLNPLLATVVTPTLKFEALDAVRTIGSSRDNFYTQWYAGAEAQVAASPQTLQLSVVNAQTAAGTYAIRATLDGVGSWTSNVTTVTAPELRWASTSKVVGHSLSVGVALQRISGGAQSATATPLTIALFSSDPAKVAVPASVTMAAGQSSVQVPLTGVDITSASVVITATALDHTPPASSLSATVIVPTLKFEALDAVRTIGSSRDNFYTQWYAGAEAQVAASPQTLQLSVVNAQVTTVGTPELRWMNASEIVGDKLKTSSVYLTRYSAVGSSAPSATFAPLTISLSCTATDVCSTPVSVTMAAGASTVYVPIQGAGLGTSRVLVSAAGHAATELDVETRTATFAFTNLATTMPIGTQRSLWVAFEVPGSNQAFVPATTTTVSLSASVPSVLSVPASTSVTADNTSSSVIPVVAAAAGTTTITASAPGFTPKTSPMITVTQ